VSRQVQSQHVAPVMREIARLQRPYAVVVRGTVRRLGSEPEILRSGVAALQAWQPGEKFNYFELQPEQIAGRFIRPRG